MLTVAARRQHAATGWDDRFDAFDFDGGRELADPQDQSDLAAGLFAVIEIEQLAQIDHDHGLAAQVEQAADRGPGVRDPGDRIEGDDLADPANLEAEASPGEPKCA